MLRGARSSCRVQGPREYWGLGATEFTAGKPGARPLSWGTPALATAMRAHPGGRAPHTTASQASGSKAMSVLGFEEYVGVQEV